MYPPQVFISAAQFESTIGEADKARGLYSRADSAMQAVEAKEERKLSCAVCCSVLQCVAVCCSALNLPCRLLRARKNVS